MLDVIIADNNNVNLNDDGIVSDTQDNNVDSGEDKGISNANRMALNNNVATSNDQNEFFRCKM